MREPDVPGRPAAVMLHGELPRTLLGDGRGMLVVVNTTFRPEPLFRATFRLDGIGMTEWQREMAAGPDMDATGVRRGRALPAWCWPARY